MATALIPQITDDEQDTANNIISGLIEPIIGDLIRIPVFNEIGLPNRDRTKVSFMYQPMITFNGEDPKFELNETTVLTAGTDYTLDKDTATITLLGTSGSEFESDSGVLTEGNEIRGTYRFQYFTDKELTSFIYQALTRLNIHKPATGFTLNGAPKEWDGPLALYSYVQVFDRILADTMLWKSSIVFTDQSNIQNQIQSKLTRAQSEYDWLAKVSQRRGWAAPKAVATRRLAVQQRVTAANFREFTLGLT